VPLEEIRIIICAKDFNGFSALQNHLTALMRKRDQLDLLIANVEKTIKAMKGEIIMSDKEKFEGFLTKLVDPRNTFIRLLFFSAVPIAQLIYPIL
jgi:hypothetical protein